MSQEWLDDQGRPLGSDYRPQVGDRVYVDGVPCRVGAVEPLESGGPNQFVVTFHAVGPRRVQP